MPFRLAILLLAGLGLAPSRALAQALPSPQVQTRPANDNASFVASTGYADRAVQTLLATSQATFAPKASPVFAGTATIPSLILGSASMKTPSPLDTTLSTRGGAAPSDYLNPNAIMLGVGGKVSFCPALSCLSGDGDTSPTNDHQRASLLVSATTQDDAHSQEQALAVVTTINKGVTTPWGTGKPFPGGANTSANGQMYRNTAACTSAASGAGPSGTALSGISDGTCSWGWINAAGINAKVGSYFETNVMPGAGPSWGAAFNYHFSNDPGVAGGFWPGVEFDYANDSGKDCAIGLADCTSIRVGIAGNGQITHGVQITGDGFMRNGVQGKSMIWGLRLNGDNAVSGTGIEVDLQSQIGLGFGASGIGATIFSQAAIRDVSTSPVGLDIGGTHTNAISIGGTVTGAQIVGNNFVVFPDGGTKVLSLLARPDSTHQVGLSYDTTADRAEIQSTHLGLYNTEIALNPHGGNVSVGGLLRETSSPPASSSSPCIAGTRTWDANYEYRCVATNTWKRAALSSW